ncbi:flagellar hook-length control protein FliK [Atopomonas sediminilitoris]|uniref:flagellar hook-length control protein FliK n=1 Tax=Atopomonas sediminilitoris TaxID=2919919 RepID=UPI001F4DAF8D|nr:flagellar hook-length control protein FliK [Atopomonas sediminilitoris]MCJ8167919.1 flagellar hook-length control protein FliK [Atopomonas sediminilitoris]
MPAHISGPPGAAYNPSVRPAQSSGLSLNVLQPISALLSVGQQAQAEVLTVQQTQQTFEVMLKLQVTPERSATVTAQSQQALTPGTQLLVQAAANNQLLTKLSSAGNPALNQLDLNELPVGSLLQGKVVAVEQLAQSKSQQIMFRVLLELLNTPLRGRLLTLDSPKALALGNLLSATVQGAQSLQWLSPSAQLDSLEIQQHLTTQLGKQGALEQLLPLMQKLQDSEQLPADTRQSLGLLLGKLPSSEQLGDAQTLKQLLQLSGINLEALLQQGGNQAQNAAQHDLKAQLLRLVATLLPHASLQAALQTATAPSQQAGVAAALGSWLRSYLSDKDSAPNQNTSFPLPNTANTDDADADLPLLLRLARAALARLQSHQLSSLQQTQTLSDGSQLQTWQLELPFREGQYWHAVQVRLQEEKRQAQDKELPQSLWRIDLALDIEPLGPLHVQAQWQLEQLSTRWWAEQANTAELVQQALPELEKRLRERGLNVTDMQCQQGKPPQGSHTGVKQRWIDETA